MTATLDPARSAPGGAPGRPWFTPRTGLRRVLLAHHLAPAARRVRPLDLLWSAFVAAMLTLMFLLPDEQTVPYHLIFVAFTLLYGYKVWSPKATITVLTIITVITGAMFARVYLMGHISLDEVAEIPLMSLIIGAMAWHAQRSAAAQRTVQELAEREGSRLERQRDFLRDTAHAIRTPVTIARGNIELIQMESPAEGRLREDTDEVLHQLDRLHHMARRLLVIEALQTSDLYSSAQVDIGKLVSDAARRWPGVAQRDWVIDSDVEAVATVDALRLEESLDAMVENALRFTQPDGRIRISCRTEGSWVVIEVADDGPGIAPSDTDRVFDRFFHRNPVGQEPGTGLGLALVSAVTTTFGGEVSAGSAPEGGALIQMRLPRC